MEVPQYWQFLTDIKRVRMRSLPKYQWCFSSPNIRKKNAVFWSNSSCKLQPCSVWRLVSSYRLCRQTILLFVKILTNYTKIWDSRLRNPSFAWLQDLECLACCHFLSRKPSMVPALTCQEAELCTVPAIPTVKMEYGFDCVTFINGFKINCNNIYHNVDIIYPGTDNLLSKSWSTESQYLPLPASQIRMKVRKVLRDSTPKWDRPT